MSNKLSGLRRAPLAVAGLALAGGFLMAGSKPALATPSGLSNYPSTDIYTKGTYHLDADYFASANGKTNNFSLIGLEYGAGPEKEGLFGRSEFGLDYVNSIGGLNHGKRFLLNAKTQLYSNPGAGLRATVGIYGFGSKDLGAANWLNALGSKAFPFGRITVGAAYATRKSVLVGSRTVLQLGYDKSLGKNLILAVDYQSGKGQFFAPGLIYLLNDKAGIELSYLRGGSALGGTGSSRNQIYFGFDYNFGKVYAPPTTPDAPAGAGGAGGAGGGGGGGG